MKVPLQPFTLIGATTRTGLLTSPLRARFGIVHRLDFYTPQDLEEIVRRSARILDVPIDDAAAAEIARRSRGTPRIANRLLRRVRDYAQVRADGTITLDVAHAALQAARGRRARLRRSRSPAAADDHRQVRRRPGRRRTASPRRSAKRRDAIEDIYEPFLIQIGFLDRTPRGRVATPRAYGYFGLRGAREGTHDCGDRRTQDGHVAHAADGRRRSRRWRPTCRRALLTNADLEKMVETTDEWILQRTGIRERHIVDPGVATSDLGKEAALQGDRAAPG